MPVVAISGVPDIVATRIKGPTVSAHPTGRYRGTSTLWSSHSNSGPIVIAIDGSTQSE